VATAH
jgi:hypothetical protein